MSKTIKFLFLLHVIFFNFVFGQNIIKEVLISDNQLYTWDYVDNSPWSRVSIDGLYDLTNISFESDNSVSPVEIDINNEFKYHYSHGDNTTYIDFTIFYNQNGIKKIKQLNLSLSPKKNVTFKQRASFANSSKMELGEWYKITFSEPGVYKVNASELTQWAGRVVSCTDINLYSYGGGMLPFNNAVFRPDDMQANNIEMFDLNGDGLFNGSDYFVFFSKGLNTHTWVNDRFVLNQHPFSFNYFAFVGIGVEPEVRLQSQLNVPTHNTVVTSFYNAKSFSPEEYNLVKSGRKYYGSKFSDVLTKNFSFDLGQITNGSSVRLDYNLAGASVGGSSSFNLSVNGQSSTNVIISGVANSYTAPAGDETSGFLTFTSNNAVQNVSLTFNPFNFNAVGYIDYLTLSAEVDMVYKNQGMLIQNPMLVGAGVVAKYDLLSSNDLYVWDVSIPYAAQKMQTNYNGNLLSFVSSADTLKQFYAFKNSDIKSVSFVNKLSNQNLHALSNASFIILTHPNFIAAANTLAEHRRSQGISTHVVTPEMIYNEFSSGVQDITAIKFFLKMFYDRSTGGSDDLKYLLLLGRSSYDLRGIINGNSNYMPSYQSLESLSPIGSYISDDYFGLLEDTDSDLISNNLNIGIGRLPVSNTTEAANVVNKIISYDLNPNTRRKWRNSISMLADDQDNNIHIRDTDILSDSIESKNDHIILNKIYFDAFKQVSTTGGARYPDVNTAINNAVNNGTLIFNYLGHGGETGLGHERVLDIPMINAFNNSEALSVFVTATCEFSRFDDPERVSAGEMVLLNPSGGAVAMLTTTRIVYTNSNMELNRAFYNHAFTKENGQYLRLGEVVRRTKNDVSASINKRNFSILGDPTMIMAFPEWEMRLDSINGIAITGVDTLRALEKVRLSGSVLDNGIVATQFNGMSYVTVYDKKKSFKTLENDNDSQEKVFQMYKGKLYSGKVQVVNGRFSFEFMVPKDIDYDFGKGRLSMYAHNNALLDATGFSTDFVVGGLNLNATADNDGPEIELFMNDENFINNGLVQNNPILLAKLYDEHGINTSGSGIGHDIIAIIDEESSSPIVLNDFYESELNSFQKGMVRFPMGEIAEGKHTLTLRAWDTYNNPSEAKVDFIVSEKQDLDIEHVLNYPNPFTSATEFMFDHNQYGRALKVQIIIFTISGKVVKTLTHDFIASGSQSEPIPWDGKDQFGDALAKGVYLYQIKVENDEKQMYEKVEKLVIL